MTDSIFKELTPEEEVEYRQWARSNFDVNETKINHLWHPVVQDECKKMIGEHKQAQNEKNT